MKIKTSRSRKIFMVCNYVFLVIVGAICLLPFVNIIAVSLSGATPVSMGAVTLWPKEFTWKSYEFIMKNSNFISSFFVSVRRVFVGVTVNLILIILTAYPLSYGKNKLRIRNVYAWFFVVTMLFNAGIVPTFLVVRYTGLMNSFWSLILPTALPVSSMLIVMNFIRGLPKELREVAFLDGAGHGRTLFYIILPLLKPALATVALFSIVSHWNTWLDGMLYISRSENQPLQTYLRTIIVNPALFLSNNTSVSSELVDIMNHVNTRTIKAAQLVIAAVPMLVVYPFVQKYFTSGLVMGSVKG